ncbi:MAG: hypothetical protein AAF597_14315 [Bacteroidota bacterium]
MTGTLTANDREWEIRSRSTANRSEITVPLPQDFVNNYSSALCDFAQGRIQERSEFYQNEFLPDSSAYTLALNLDGLRQQIPPITSRARQIIDQAIIDARNSCVDALPDIVCFDCNLPNPCDVYIRERVTPVVNQFRRILDNLDAAVAAELTDEEARAAIKRELQALVDRQRMTFGSLEVRLCTKPGFLPCANLGIRRTIDSRTRDIYTDSQLDLLQRALANVDRIPSAEADFLDSEQIYADLTAALGDVPAACQDSTVTIPTAVAMGYEQTHDNLATRFFYDEADGSRVYVADFNPFDPLSFSRIFN